MKEETSPRSLIGDGRGQQDQRYGGEGRHAYTCRQ
jgi:hypothetical protein